MTTMKREKIEVMNFSGLLTKISAVLFFMFILLKPYYLKPSGSIGAADICLAAAGAVMLAAELMRIMSIRCRAEDGDATLCNRLINGTALGNAAEKKSIYEALSENSENFHAYDKRILELPSAAEKKAGSKRGWREVLNIYVNELLYRQDIALYAFILLAAAVNAVYCIRLGSQEYTKYTVYWLYNGLAVWTMRKLRDADERSDAVTSVDVLCEKSVDDSFDSAYIRSADIASVQSAGNANTAGAAKTWLSVGHMSRMNFREKLCLLLEADILIQFIIMLSGHGRYFVEYWGAVRYMGSFNDPNQLAFFMFISVLLIYSLTSENGRKLHLSVNEAAAGRALRNENRDICYAGLTVRFVIYISALIIIIKTKSTGIMLGVAAFAFLLWCRWIWETMKSGRISRKLITAVVIICAVCAAGLLIHIWPSADFDVKNVEYNTLTRIQEKLWKLSQGGIGGFLTDRGGGKLAAFPQYMIFGAGEGGFDRFALSGQEINEIHCGPMSILFCYGIIPAVFMLKWLVDSLKCKNSRQLCACLALIAESMTLINYRQPMFWFLLM